MLVENRVFEPPAAARQAARIDSMAAYHALCDEAERDHDGFRARLARENLVWTKPLTRVLDASDAPFYRWFDDGQVNVSANCLDRHMGTAASSIPLSA